MILTTEEVITTNLKIISASTNVMLATEEVIIVTLNVISAITKVILATNKLVSASKKISKPVHCDLDYWGSDHSHLKSYLSHYKNAVITPSVYKTILVLAKFTFVVPEMTLKWLLWLL